MQDKKWYRCTTREEMESLIKNGFNFENEIKIFKLEELGKVRVVKINEVPYFCAYDIGKILGYRNTRDLVLRYCESWEHFFIPTESGVQKLNFINEKNVLLLISSCKKLSNNDKKSIIENFQKYGIINKSYIPVFSRKEIEFISDLEDFFDAQNIIKGIKQFKILNYVIDYYIPSIKLAIEYDENEHKNYSYETHEGRQKEIEKELGCKFIRISDKNTNAYNLGLIMKEIVA